MLEFNGKAYLDISFPELSDFVITSKSFSRLVIRQEADNKMPIAELNLKIQGYEAIEQFDKDNLKMEASYATNKEKALDNRYSFILTNLSIKSHEDHIALSLFFILDLYSFMNKPIISFKEGLSSEVILAFTEIEINKDTLYEGKDKQIWIQHTIPEKEYLSRILRAAKSESFPLSAVTADKKLSVIDVKKEFEKEATITLHNGPYSEGHIFSSFEVSTKRGVLKSYFGDNRSFPIIDFYKAEKHENISSSKEASQAIAESNFDEKAIEYGKPFQMKYNAGNVHESYFDTMQKNLKSKALLYSRPLSIVFAGTSFPDSEIKLLDLCEVHIFNPGTKKEIEYLSGKYLVVEKNVDITESGINTQFMVVR